MKGTRLLLPLGLSLFPFLAAANSAGYRYGASDLAFYGPAVMRQLDPALFPRDTPLIDAQARLTLMDETIAAVARVTTTDLPALFLGLYLATLALLAVAGALIGGSLYRSPWTIAALLAALTLRHAVPKSGTNTLEAYFHPRQLAFAFGALAVAAFLRGRPAAVGLALGGAALLHPTTALWFGIWLAVAFAFSERRALLPVIALAATAIAAVAAAWTAGAGPLAGRLGIMDPAWLDAIADKDYLFPLAWPAAAWIVNLGYAPLIWIVYRHRERTGALHPGETGLVAGCLALVAVFLAACAVSAGHVALAIQLQPARVFWLLDFLAVVYAVWAIAEGRGGTRRAAAVAAALLLVTAARSAYVMRVEFPGRPLFERSVPGDWGRVMAWARDTPRDTGWLADPDHASRYGTSVRMAAGRDVFVEAVKDAAVGMYDRSVAFRTRDRLRELGDFPSASAERLRELAGRYSLDYAVTERELALPLAFQSGALRVYRLR